MIKKILPIVVFIFACSTISYAHETPEELVDAFVKT